MNPVGTEEGGGGRKKAPRLSPVEKEQVKSSYFSRLRHAVSTDPENATPALLPPPPSQERQPQQIDLTRPTGVPQQTYKDFVHSLNLDMDTAVARNCILSSDEAPSALPVWNPSNSAAGPVAAAPTTSTAATTAQAPKVNITAAKIPLAPAVTDQEYALRLRLVKQLFAHLNTQIDEAEGPMHERTTGSVTLSSSAKGANSSDAAWIDTDQEHPLSMTNEDMKLGTSDSAASALTNLHLSDGSLWRSGTDEEGADVLYLEAYHATATQLRHARYTEHPSMAQKDFAMEEGQPVNHDYAGKPKPEIRGESKEGGELYLDLDADEGIERKMESEGIETMNMDSFQKLTVGVQHKLANKDRKYHVNNYVAKDGFDLGLSSDEEGDEGEDQKGDGDRVGEEERERDQHDGDDVGEKDVVGGTARGQMGEGHGADEGPAPSSSSTTTEREYQFDTPVEILQSIY